MSFQAINLPSTRFSSDPSCWPHPNAQRRTQFGQHVLWHDVNDGGRHIPACLLDKYRLVGDPPVDRILQLYAHEGRTLRAGDDLFDRRMASESSSASPADKLLRDFFDYYGKVPDWVDIKQLEYGQRVLLAYLPSVSISLFYRSLVPGFSIPKIAKVLQATAYLAPPSSNERVYERLTDTGALISACTTGGLDSILPHGKGWKAALQVRILHAKVRSALLNRTGSRKWNIETLGVPINQEDNAATLLAFSANAMLGSEMILGIPLPQQDLEAFMALWRYLGWILGVPTIHDTPSITNSLQPLDPCGPGWQLEQPNTRQHAYAVFQSIIFHIVEPDESSVQISHHLLHVGRLQEKNRGLLPRLVGYNNFYFFRALQCRRFIGNLLADALELPLHPVWYVRWRIWLVSTACLWFLRFYTIAALPLSPWRERLLRFHHDKMVIFERHWQESHMKRMKDGLDLVDGSNNGCCPFAMVLPSDGDV